MFTTILFKAPIGQLLWDIAIVFLWFHTFSLANVFYFNLSSHCHHSSGFPVSLAFCSLVTISLLWAVTFCMIIFFFYTILLHVLLLLLLCLSLPAASGHKCLRHSTKVLDTQVLISPTQEQVQSEVRDEWCTSQKRPLMPISVFFISLAIVYYVILMI